MSTDEPLSERVTRLEVISDMIRERIEEWFPQIDSRLDKVEAQLISISAYINAHRQSIERKHVYYVAILSVLLSFICQAILSLVGI